MIQATVYIQTGMQVAEFARFDSLTEAFDCYQDLRENHVFNEDQFPFVETGWFN